MPTNSSPTYNILVGEMYFVNGDYCWSSVVSIGCGLTPIVNPANATDIVDLEQFFGGSYLDRMNYNNFMNAYTTVFNVMFLNNWHQLMVRMIKMYDQSWYFWYFLFLVFICNYFVTAILMSSVTEVMEQHAKKTLTDEAGAHKSFVKRLERIRTNI
mgnify:CR=1 FL=1